MSQQAFGVAFGLLLVLGIVLFGVVPLWWIWRGYPKVGAAPPSFRVSIDGDARGTVEYGEGEHAHRFTWERAAGRGIVGVVRVPTEAAWSAELPWAALRREDVLDRVAAELKRERFPESRWTLFDDRIEWLER